MPLTCPACNKAGQTEAACSRCGCDLSRLHVVARSADARLARARMALADLDWATAHAEALAAWRLRHSAAAAEINVLACAAQGRFATAQIWRERGAER